MEAEQASVQIKMKVEVFEDVVQAASGEVVSTTDPPGKRPSDRKAELQKWKTMRWSTVVSLCRSDNFLKIESSSEDVNDPSEGSS